MIGRQTGLARRIPDFLFDNRKILVILIIAVSLVMGVFIPRLQQDLSLKSMMVTSSETYKAYERFVEDFGNDEFVLVVIKRDKAYGSDGLLDQVDAITRQLEKLDYVTEVLSVSNLHLFQKRGPQFGNYRLVKSEGGSLSLPPSSDLTRIRNALPVVDLLVSQDQKAFGILVRIDERWKYDIDKVKTILGSIQATVKNTISSHDEWRMVGATVLRDAVGRYGMQTVQIFSTLCTIICLCVIFFVFRSLKVTAALLGVLGVCGFWVMGLVALFDMPLTPTNSLAPGLVLIQTLEFVIHVATRFRQFRPLAQDRIGAGRETVRFLARPCFFCAATTAVGYGACMVSQIPGVFQMGLIMALGSLLAYFVTFVLTPSLVVSMRSFDAAPEGPARPQSGSRVIEYVIAMIQRHHRIITAGAILYVIFMIGGAPQMRTDPQLIRELGSNGKEALDIDFVRSHLASVYYLEVAFDINSEHLENPQLWAKMKDAEESIRKVNDVVTTESLLGFLEYMYWSITKERTDGQDLVNNPEAVRQLLFAMSSSPDGEKMIRRYLGASEERVRVSVRIRNSPSKPVTETISEVHDAASSAVAGLGKVTVTGTPVVYASLGETVIESERNSLAVGVVLITFLMMIQMRSALFGLISLIPNIPPIATIFGLIGWAGMPMGGITIFAATVALGLAVDNTIQFVAQFRREIRLNPTGDAIQCMFQAYRLAAKPMASWSIVIVLGFLAMLGTPLQVVREFGILVAAAMIMGMFGDLVLFQSVVVRFPVIRDIIRGIMEKEMRNES